jgi:hypothetical protein
MFNGTLTLITQVRPESVEPLARLLQVMDHRIEAGEPHPFDGMESVHFAHWAILGLPPPGAPSSRPAGKCYLLLGADLCLVGDPPRRARLAASVEQLVDGLAARRARPGVALFDAIYGHCVGYPEAGLSQPRAVKEYLLRNAVNYTARHVDFAYRVTTVQGVRELARLRGDAERFLDAPSLRPRLEDLSVSKVHKALRYHVAENASLLSDPEWDRRLAAARFKAARSTALLALPGLALSLVLKGVEKLRGQCPISERVVVPDALREEIEARQYPVQNSMILVTAIPDNRMARLKQRFFLRLVNLRLQRNVVGLNDIRTIHFARWVAFERGGEKQLIFMVTYDESWDAYIDSFIDNEDVSNFLKAIWSPTKGFPQGKPFVEPFKQWIRSVQCPTRAWYSAYRHGRTPLPVGTAAGISVTDLHEALQLRRVLARESLRGLRNLRERWAMRTYLEQGRFPFQKKLMGAGEVAFHILVALLSRLRLRLTGPGRTRHVELGKERAAQSFALPQVAGAEARAPSLA